MHWTEFLNRHASHQPVASDAERGEDRAVDLTWIPSELRRLIEIRREVDPGWDLRAWLAERAAEELGVAEMELETERIRLEQRLRRMRRLRDGPDDVTRADQVFNGLSRRLRRSPGQRGIFEDFEEPFDPAEAWAEAPDPTPPEWPLDQEMEEPGSLGAWADGLPETPDDDPLLALVAQLLLFELASADRSRALPLSLEGLVTRLEGRGVGEDEVFEALEWLVECELVLELEDGFAPNDAFEF